MATVKDMTRSDGKGTWQHAALALHEAPYPEVISVKTYREREAPARPSARAVPFAGPEQLTAGPAKPIARTVLRCSAAAPAKPFARTVPRCSIAGPAKPIARVGRFAASRMLASYQRQHHASPAHAQLAALAWVWVSPALLQA
jgi:hypothetical protein